MVQLLTPTKEHIAYVAKTVRHPDIAWYTETLGMSVERMIELAIETSTRTWAFVENDELLAIFGIKRDFENLVANRAEIWIYSTDASKRYPVTYLRATRVWMQEILETYSELVAYIDERFTESIRMCQWLGFETHGPVQIDGGPRFYILEKK